MSLYLYIVDNNFTNKFLNVICCSICILWNICLWSEHEWKTKGFAGVLLSVMGKYLVSSKTWLSTLIKGHLYMENTISKLVMHV